MQWGAGKMERQPQGGLADGGRVGAPHKPWEGRQEAVEGWDEGIRNQRSV